jgi:hypothetical protein
MAGRWKLAVGATVVALVVALATAGAASAAPSRRATAPSRLAAAPAPSHLPAAPASGTLRPLPPSQARACGASAAGHARCHAIELLHAAANWHPGRPAKRPGGGGGGGGTVKPPTSGYYPADLQSAYNLTSAEAAATGAGPAAPTIAIVDAYDDPYAASDLAAYRTSLSRATDSATGLTDGTIPRLCTGSPAVGCVTFTKVNQSGLTSYPRANTGWAEEISLDLDMATAICPDCNITLVEAATSSFSNLQAAVAYAKTLNPAVITNSYGGSESGAETSDNATYSATAASGGSGTAMTAATGDSGYGVEFPAASPGLTAVGGTSLTYTGTGTGISWSQRVWSGAGAGCSADEPMPSWQKNSAYSSSGCSGRQVADVSAVADPNTGVAVYDSFREPGWMVFGGTSASTQIVGAIYALAAFGQESPLPSALYPDSASTSATGPTPGLTPVTSGSDGSCGTYLCDAAHSLSSGYNGPAGLGTPDGVGAFSSTTG